MPQDTINIASNDADFLENMGDIYLALKNKEKAKEFWIKSKAKGNNSDELLSKIKNN
jgi:predicted negative regulator of RcsB-dependent stress response